MDTKIEFNKYEKHNEIIEESKEQINPLNYWSEPNRLIDNTNENMQRDSFHWSIADWKKCRVTHKNSDKRLNKSTKQI